jgi:hypothetical protein
MHMVAWKCFNDFSAPSSSNIRTGSEMNVGDGNFEIKPALINVVQQSTFCWKALEDANAHLQHFLEIYDTLTIQGTSLPFSILIIGEGKAVVLHQQGSCVHLGEVLQCICHQVLSTGQDQCPPKQDLELSIAHGQNHC